MKKYLLLLPVISFFLSSCEKETTDDYTLKFFGDAYEDIGYSVSIASDGYIIAGQVTDIVRESGVINNDLSKKNLAVIKTDWNGNLTWQISAGGKYDDWGRKIYQLEDGSMICVGTMTDTVKVTHGTDIYVVRISAEGNKLWEKAYGGERNQTGVDIIQTEYGFLVLGTTDKRRDPDSDFAGNEEGKTDIYVLGISGSGDSLTSRAYGFTRNDIPAAVKYDNDGNLVVFCTVDFSESSVPPMANNNLLIFKIKTTTDVISKRVFGDVSDEYAADIEVVPDGYMVSGTIGKETDIQEAFVRFVPGNIQSAIDPSVPFRIDGASTSITSMFRTADGNYILAGQTGSGSAADMLIFETDKTGAPVEGKKLVTGSTGAQVAYDVVSGEDGFIVAVGKNSYEYNSLISLLKFRF
jgi:hypothetical protein